AEHPILGLLAERQKGSPGEENASSPGEGKSRQARKLAVPRQEPETFWFFFASARRSSPGEEA
ncbi:hypothetical protein A2U01_0059440, partial [Trifolium medium]|nr:hypothetical protein [Trifolium medium]